MSTTKKDDSGRGMLFAALGVAVVTALAIGGLYVARSLSSPDKVKKLSKDCEKGWKFACYELAELYAKGEGKVKKDDDKAAEFYRRGCDNDHGVSCTALGRLYRQGVAGLDDKQEANRLFQMGCGMGDKDACTLIDGKLAAATTKGPNGQAGKKDWSKELPAPPDVAAVPKDATKSKSGLAHKLLTKGKSNQKAGLNDTVTMNFTVWKTNGKLYYSTHQRKRPLTISLAKAPPGWVEAVGLMTVGEKRRFWMPPELGFRKGAKNAQLLVYEIELVSTKEGPKTPADVAAPPANARLTKFGVRYRVLSKGKGNQRANMWDQVTFKHTGWTTKGKLFDSSEMRKRTAATFPYKLSVGLEQVVTQMVVGDKIRAWIPEKVAKMGARGLPKGMLVYDLELQTIKKMKKPPPVPRSVAKPPANVQKTAKGVFYKVLKRGTGAKKPAKTDRVRVHYTGWTTDGRMFDSSVVRGQPSEFPVNRVIPGWTDGLQTMVAGESTRFWIPFELAYKGKPNRPQGMLVFDIQLLEIKKVDPSAPNPRGRALPPGARPRGGRTR